MWGTAVQQGGEVKYHDIIMHANERELRLTHASSSNSLEKWEALEPFPPNFSIVYRRNKYLEKILKALGSQRPGLRRGSSI